jgi:hypothetical protein
MFFIKSKTYDRFLGIFKKFQKKNPRMKVDFYRFLMIFKNFSFSKKSQNF